MKKVGWMILFSCIPFIAFSATVNVPADYATIQAGIDAAVAGDTVLVAPGYYVENIDFLGKGITVKSSDGPLQTIIDGKDWTNPDVLSTVVFKTFEGLDSVLEGFTITGGHGTLGAWGDYHGGGIHITEASPTIKYNVITGNNVDGLYSGGGAIHGYHTSAHIIGNVMVGNWSAYSGGGFDCTGDDPTLLNNVIIGNKTGGNYGAFGGGISINACDAATLTNNLIAYNVAGVDPGAPGSPKAGAIAFWNSGFPVMQNCTLAYNHVVDGSGGGIVAGYNSFPTVSDCVLWGNYADAGTAVLMYASPCDMTIDYCDVEGGFGACDVDPACNLFWGSNMMDLDPLFATGPDGYNYLSEVLAGQPSTSPCIDAGSDTSANLGLDALWTRTDEAVDKGAVDMGYHYGDCAIPSLQLNAGVIPYTFGAKVKFMLNAGAANANRNYLVLGGVTGTTPGTLLPGGYTTLPLNWDVFTDIVLANINGPLFSNFMGKLGANGEADALLYTPPLPSVALGLRLYFAFCCNSYFDVASNSVVLEVVN